MSLHYSDDKVITQSFGVLHKVMELLQYMALVRTVLSDSLVYAVFLACSLLQCNEDIGWISQEEVLGSLG